jgi:hypothetical protein
MSRMRCQEQRIYASFVSVVGVRALMSLLFVGPPLRYETAPTHPGTPHLSLDPCMTRCSLSSQEGQMFLKCTDLQNSQANTNTVGRKQISAILMCGIPHLEAICLNVGTCAKKLRVTNSFSFSVYVRCLVF